MTAQHHADLAVDAYRDYAVGTFIPRTADKETINGVQYRILAHRNNPATGYQGTIYQRIDSGEITVAHRGTEFDREAFKDGVLTDGGMVLARTNAQAADAIALTRLALGMAQNPLYNEDYHGRRLPVTVTGHSLGGTNGQITAHHFDLEGHTFNAYGAASLSLRIPEGGHKLVNHVMAGDAVSAASPHFGQVKIYARAQELQTLRANGYDNQRHWSDALRGYSPGHFGTGMTPPSTIGAALGLGDSHRGAHFVGATSVLADERSNRLAQTNAVQIEEYRQDVRKMRSLVTVAARGKYNVQDGIDAWRGPLPPGEPARMAGHAPLTLSPVSERLLIDSQSHVRALADRHGLRWDSGMDNTVCAAACAARAQGLERITHMAAAQGRLKMAHFDGAVIREASLNARAAANTPVDQSLSDLAQLDQMHTRTARPLAVCTAPAQEQTATPFAR